MVDPAHGNAPPEDVDALLVLNQDATGLVTSDWCRRHGFRSLVVLATHRLFPSEETLLRAAAPQVHFLCFGDLLDDAELGACDEEAHREALAERVGQVDPAFLARFMLRTSGLKNQAAYRKVIQRFRPRTICYSPGLGIIESVWAGLGGWPASPVPASSPVRETTTVARSRLALRRLRTALDAPPTVFRLTQDGDPTPYLFFGGIARLRFAPPSVPRPVAPSATAWIAPAMARSPRLAALGADATLRLRDGGRPWRPCTTIHGYSPWLSRLAQELGRELLIFVDGYHPPNYPRSYLDQFGSGTFICPSVISARWFSRHGRKVRGRLAFQQSELFASCQTQPVHTVLLALNHAGNWSALINRSDTDTLITAFTGVARGFPRQRFVVRLHPTMARPEHEGLGSHERVRRFIEDLHLPNLLVSRATLEEDCARADLCISEYSQVLIDMWRLGKPGVAVNLTRRRSFMEDYAALGFPHVESTAALTDLVGEALRDIGNLAQQQSAAAEQLNHLQRQWDAEAGLR